MPQKPVDVPTAPEPKNYRIEFKVTAFIRTNHLSIEAIEQAIHAAVQSRDGFAYVSNINITHSKPEEV